MNLAQALVFLKLLRWKQKNWIAQTSWRRRGKSLSALLTVTNSTEYLSMIKYVLNAWPDALSHLISEVDYHDHSSLSSPLFFALMNICPSQWDTAVSQWPLQWAGLFCSILVFLILLVFKGAVLFYCSILVFLIFFPLLIEKGVAMGVCL